MEVEPRAFRELYQKATQDLALYPRPLIRQSRDIGELIKDLGSAKQALDGVKHNRTVNTGTFAFTYADLHSLIEADAKVLAKYGVVIIQGEAQWNGHWVLVTKLAHTSGQWIETDTRMDGDAKEHGSALTYRRRYGRSAALDQAAEQDNDAFNESAPGAKKSKVQQTWGK